MRVRLGNVRVGAGSIFAPLDPIPGDPPRLQDNIGDFFRLDHFQVSKTTYLPFEQIEVEWAIAQVDPSDPSISLVNYRFALAGAPPFRTIESDLAETVPEGGVHPAGTLSGTLSVTLFEDTTLFIRGAPRGTDAWETLGSPLSVSPDTSTCETESIPRSVVDAAVTAEVSNLTSSTASVTPRGEMEVTWDRSYISYYLPLNLVLPTMFNADLNITLRVGFGVTHEGQESHVNVSIGYSSDVVFSKWENVGSFGVAGQVEAAVEGLIPLVLECITHSGEARLMRGILDLIEEYSDSHRLLAVRIVPSAFLPLARIEIVLCPNI